MSHPGVRLSPSVMEAKYRMALSRIELATQEIEQLEAGGYGVALHFVLAELAEAQGNLIRSRDKMAEKYGFTPREGIGPGDWKEKQ